MERETELTQSWSPALNEEGGLLKGIPLLVGGEMRTFSLPAPLDDDGTDISLKDWQLGSRSSLDRETPAPYSVKPFKGSVRTRFTPMEPRLDEDLSPRHSSPDHFETPTTPRTPRTSSSGTRSSSVSPSKSFLQEGASTPPPPPPVQHEPSPADVEESSQSQEPPHQSQNLIPASGLLPSPRTPGGVAFDVTLEDATPDTNNLRARSLRVSFLDDDAVPPQRRPSPPKVRHRSPLKSRSLHPPKEVKALQPKWESSTKIRPITPTTTTLTTKPHVQAPPHGVRARKGIAAVKPRSSTCPPAQVVPLPAPEIEPELQSASGYLSEGRALGSDRYGRRSLDSQSTGDRSRFDLYSSNRLSSRNLAMSPNQSGREDPSNNPNSPSFLLRSHGRRQDGDDPDDHVTDDEEDVKVSMLCGGGLSETKLSGEFGRLLSKLCRVSVPAPKQTRSQAPASSQQRSRKHERSNTTSVSWESPQSATTRANAALIGRHDSLKLLSERCSNAPAPAYNVHKPRKIRNHEPHQHFYRTISKTLDQKLKS